MAVAQLGIDTDIVVDYLRKRSDVLERAIGRFDCALTAVTVYELEIGLVDAPRQRTLFQQLVDIVTVLPLDRGAASAAAKVYVQLRAQGLPIGVQDTLIAGTCIAHSVPLLTRNIAHFGQVGGLSVIEPSQLE